MTAKASSESSIRLYIWVEALLRLRRDACGCPTRLQAILWTTSRRLDNTGRGIHGHHLDSREGFYSSCGHQRQLVHYGENYPYMQLPDGKAAIRVGTTGEGNMTVKSLIISILE